MKSEAKQSSLDSSQSGVEKGLDIDRDLMPNERIRRALKNRSLLSVAVDGIDRLLIFVLSTILGPIFYKRRYLKGRWFRHPWSEGWRWVWTGILSKVFLGKGRGIPWPISPNCVCGRDVFFDVNDLNNFQSSSYFQTFGDAVITLGRGVYIANGCALITSNHDPANPDVHLKAEDIVIGDHCWLGTNVVITPGVELGPYTTVGANAVVTKSFKDGHCVIAGIPAQLVRSTAVYEIEMQASSDIGDV